jgi:hypothetical protein
MPSSEAARARTPPAASVNAGDKTVSAFALHGGDLEPVNVVPSGGELPISVAVSGRLVYILNAAGGSPEGAAPRRPLVPSDSFQPLDRVSFPPSPGGARMSKSDEQKLAALIKKNAAKAAKAKQQVRRRFDETLQPEVEEDDERKKFFSEMKKREF